MSGEVAARLVMTAGVTAAVVAIVGVLSLHYRRKGSGRAPSSGRQRMPKFMMGFGIVLVLLGAVFGLILPVADPEDHVPLMVFSFAMSLGGLLFIALYLGWFLEVWDDALRVRTLLRGERTIWFRDIVSYRFGGQPNAPLLTIRTANGDRFTTNYRTFDLRPLLAVIRFHQETGQWPPQSGRVPAPLTFPDPRQR